MAGDYARSVQILVEIAGNPEAKLDEINKKLSNLEGKKTNIGIGDQPVNQVNKLSEGITRTNSSFGTLGNTVQGFGSKISSAFSGVKSSLNELNTGIQNLATGIAGIAIGGAVSGIAWMDSAKSKLYNEQIKEAINNNRKLGISYKELEEFAKQQEAQGEGTKSANIKETYAILNYGQKFFKGTSGDKLKQADAISDFWFANQERMKDFGYSSPEQVVKMLTRTQGKMQGRMVKDAAAALGLDENAPEMKTAKSRMKYLQEMGANINMQKALDERPWIRLETSIAKLKKAIGSSIAEPMAGIVLIVASIAETIAKIPGLPMLIGFSGAMLAMASAAGLLIGVLTPLWTFMKAINATLGISTALKTVNAAATTSEAVSHAMLTGAMGTEFAAEELSNVSKNISIGTRLRLIGVMAMERISSLATTAANWLGIPALLGLAGANTAAAGAATGLAVAEGLALSPLLAIAAAGLVLVGVFGLILQKAGILEPLLKGISKINLGKVFKELGAGDLFGAWHQITKGFELPSMKDAFANLMGPSLTTTLTKVFGITMNRMLEWLNSINDELRRIRALWDYIVGLIYKYIWDPLDKIVGFVERIVNKILGVEEGPKELDAATQTALDNSKAPIDEWGTNAYRITDISTGEVHYYTDRALAETALKSGRYVVTGQAPSPEQKIQRGIKEDQNPGTTQFPPVDVSIPITPDIQKQIDEGSTPIGLGESAQEPNGGYYPKKKEEPGILDKIGTFLAGGSSKNGGYFEMPVPINALGGDFTKSGLAWNDINEAIVPAEINRNSHLINVLEAIAGSSPSSFSNNTHGDIIINIDYKVSGSGSGNGMYLDKFAFERAVTEIIGKVTRHYGAY